MTENESSAADEQFLVRRDSDGIVSFSINSPRKKNAVDIDGWQELLALLRTIRAPRDRVLVITGEGKDFCSGNDISKPPTADRGPIDQMRLIGETATALASLTIPTIARVDGVAVGAGMNLALACDFIISSDRARFSQIFINMGLSIDFGGSWILPRLIGLKKAKELTLLGDIIDAPTASDLGLLYKMVPSEELDGAVAELAGRLSKAAPIALALSKSLLNNAFDVTLSQAVADESVAQTINAGTHDAREAAKAFIQKRKPVFEGR